MFKNRQIFIVALIISPVFLSGYSYAADAAQSVPQSCVDYAVQQCARFDKSVIYPKCLTDRINECLPQ